MKVLFCDIRGTLSIGSDFTADFINLSEGPLKNLAAIKTAIPDLKVVITSDIRFSTQGATMGRVLAFLRHIKIPRTDILPPTPKHDTRSLEIATWLETRKDVTHYAIIDDTWVGHPNTYLVSSDTGLDAITTEKIIAHLNA